MIKKWHRPFIFIAVCLSMALINLDITIVNLALPTIGHKLHAQLITLQWVSVSYLITATVFFALGGRFCDRLGEKTILLVGIGLFLIGSIVSGFAMDGITIVIGRAIQGSGFGISFPGIVAAACNLYSTDDRPKAVAMIAATAGIVQCIGPSLGGTILHYLDWHWIFYINIPICITIILCIVCCYHAKKLPKPKQHLTIFGAIFYFISIVAVIYSLNTLQRQSINWWMFAILLTVGVALFITSFYFEARKKNAAIPFELFYLRPFRLVVAIRGLSQFLFFSLLFFMPFYLEGVIHLSVLNSSLTLICLSGGFGVVAVFSARITKKLKTGNTLILANVILFVASIACFISPHLDQRFFIYLFLTLTGASIALVVTASMVYTINHVPKSKMGSATGFFYSLSVGVNVSIAIAITGLIMSITKSHIITSGLHKIGITLSTADTTLLFKAISGVVHKSMLKPTFSATQIQQIVTLAENALRQSLEIIASLGVITSSICIILIYRAKKITKAGEQIDN